MLIDKSIKVEKGSEEIAEAILGLVVSLKNGTAVGELINDLAKLQSLMADFKGLSADFQESFPGTVKAFSVNAIDLAAVLLGK